jgi:hypothetical protein
MRKRLIIAFAVLNAGLAMALLGSPAETQIMASSIFGDCCEEVEGDYYCCESCCWFIHTCDTSSDCNE